MPGETPATSELHSFQPAECAATLSEPSSPFFSSSLSSQRVSRIHTVKESSRSSPLSSQSRDTVSGGASSSSPPQQYFLLLRLVLLSRATPALLVHATPPSPQKRASKSRSREVRIRAQRREASSHWRAADLAGTNPDVMFCRLVPVRTGSDVRRSLVFLPITH